MRCRSIYRLARVSCGCLSNLNEDQIVTAHRSHAHYLAGSNLKKMISELHGKFNGCAGGKGGSMHLSDVMQCICSSNYLSTIPIGVGAAWANKLKNKNNIVVIFWRRCRTGVFYESLNFQHYIS